MKKLILKDIVENKFFYFNDIDESNHFCERYNNPNNLIEVRKVYFDGSGFNGIESKICYGMEGDFTLITFKKDYTSNTAEYKALIYLLKYFVNDHDIIIGDSQLIINQVTGRYKCNATHLIKLRDEVLQLIEGRNLTFRWKRRHKNLAGLELDKIKLLRTKRILTNQT